MNKVFNANSPALFEHEVRETARTFGRDGTVNVIFQGDQAGTVGNTIVFPSLDHNKTLTHGQVMVSRGYVDHEAAHIKHTDMPLFEREKEKATKAENHLLATTINALEDLRIEKITTDAYPGAQKNLVATTDQVIRHFMDTHGKDESVWSDTERLAPLATTWMGRKAMGYNSEALDEAIAKLDPKLRAKAERWAKMVSLARGEVGRDEQGQHVYDGKPGTSDVIDIAKTIVKEILNDDEDEKDQEQQPVAGDGGGGTADLNRRPDGDPNADKTQGGHGAKSAYETEDGTPPSSKIEPFAVDLNLEHALGGMLGSGAKVYRPITRASDKWHTRKDVRGKYLAYDGRDYTFGLRLQHGSGRERYANIVAKTGGKVGVMRRKLERAIQAKQRREWDGSKEYGRLDSKRLVAAVTGVPTVFKERREAPALNTAISMLIDLSGSMSGPKVQLAEQAAICLCEALDKTGIAYEVLGFCNRSGHVDKAVDKFVSDESNADHEYSRWAPLDMYVFKDYGERLREAHTAMGAISSCSGGDNSDSEALLYAYARLASRPEPKKIMLVLSDGFPASWCSYGTKHLYQHLRNVVADIAKSGTHIIGIGINSDAVKQFYPKYVVLEDLDDLSKNVLDQIGKMILGDRYMADNGDLIAVTSM